MRLVLATRNAGKVGELAARLRGLVEVVGLDAFPGQPEVEESGATFADNARLKALAAAQHTELPALADDSGLCVDLLGGAPGIRSARYAPGTDAERVQALLQAMQQIAAPRRTAYFFCALCLAIPGGPVVEVEGRCQGTIALAPRGGAGFGYDPVFEDACGRTFGELTAEEKGRISHRARALEAMLPHLRDLAQRVGLARPSAAGLMVPADGSERNGA